MFLSPGPAYSASYSVTFIAPTSAYAGVTYSTSGAGNVLTFRIQAQNPVGTNDSAVTDAVVVGLYDTATGLPADPSAVFVPSSGSPVTGGTAPMSFVSGVLNFSVTLTAGSNSMQVSVSGPNIISGNTYPGAIGNTSGPGYLVRGYFQPYYLETSSGTSVAAVYAPLPTPGPTDLLLDSSASLLIGNTAVTIAVSDSVTNSLCFAVTGVNGGYAAGGAGVSFNLYMFKQDNSFTAPVSYEVILDYGNAPSGPLTDYNNPDLTYDRVYQGFINNVIATNYPGINANQISSVSGAALQPFMTNGQIILRAWAPTTVAGQPTTITGPIYLVWASYTLGNLSYVNIPYSSSNVQPVRSVITFPGSVAYPVTVLDGGPVTLVDTFLNQFNSPLTQMAFLVPANSSGVSNWSFSSAKDPLGSDVIVNPSGSTPGTITVNASSNPIVTNQSYPVTLVGTASGQDGSWPLSMVSALNVYGNSAPMDSSKTFVYSIAAPSPPGSFTALPANYVGGGGAVALSWGQVTNESPLGYVMIRTPAGGDFTGSVTLPSGTVLSNAVTLPISQTSYNDSVTNLTGYSYQILAYNTVAESTTSSLGPVTAFANPAAPGPVTALTGGTTVQLNWGAPASVSGSYAVTGLLVLRSTSSSMSGAVTVATLAGSTTTYNDPAPVAASLNYYELVSLDSQYPSGPAGAHISAVSSQAQGFPPGYPPTGAFTTLVSVSPATIGLSWTAPDPTLMLNGPVTGYQVQISPDGVFGRDVTVGVSPATYDDSSVAIGHYYVYQVSAFDSNGALSNPSSPVTGYILPAAPTGLTASSGAAAITLNWNSVNNQGVTGYTLYRNGISVGTTASATTYPDSTGLIVGVNYIYQVSASNAGGEGPLSLPVTMPLLPHTPTGLAVTATASDTVTLTWSVPSAPETNITGYNLYRSPSATFGAGATLMASGAPGYSFTDATLGPSAAGNILYYYAQAQNLGGPSTVSPAVGVMIPPNAPTGVGASSTAATITVSWTANPASENVLIYTIYRSTNPAGPFTSVLATVTSPGTSFADGGAVAGTNYYYELTATNPGKGVTIAGGESLPSSVVFSTLLPPAPSGFSVVADPAIRSNVDLTWSSATLANVTSYNLYRNTAPTTVGSTEVSIGIPVTAAGVPVTSLTDPGLSAGTTYFYFLGEQNPAGAGAPAMKGLQIPPNPPAPVTVSPGSTAITVSWAPNPASENVFDYSVYRSQLPSVPITQLLANVPSPGTSYADSTPAQGVTYYYNVTATNAGSGVTILGGESLLSAAVTSGLAPPAPTGLGISSISASNDISVTWNNVTGAAPNASSVSLLVNNTNQLAGATGANLVPASSVSYYDQGLYAGSVTGESPDTTYYYWLETNNFFGSGSPEGPVTQLTYPAAPVLNSVNLLPDNVSVVLNWNTVGAGDVAKYNIYRQLNYNQSVSIQAVPVTAGFAMPVTFQWPVQFGQTYSFQISATNPTGEGPASNSITILIGPSSPASLLAQSGVSPTQAAVSLTWAANPAIQAITGYNIYRANGPITGSGPATAAYTPITSVPSTSTTFVDTTAADGTAYYYLVEAELGGLMSPLNTALAAPVTAFRQPNPPVFLAATAGNNQVALSWTAPAATTYPVSGYDVFRSNSVTLTGAPLTFLPYTAAAYTDNAVTNGTTYTYALQTVDVQGNLSAQTAPVSAQPLVQPGAPVSVALYAGDQEVQITWLPGSPGTLPIGAYQIYRTAVGSGVTILVATVNSTITGFVDMGLADLTTYTYWLVSEDTSGIVSGLHISANSALVTGMPSTGNINPPSSLSAQGQNALVAVTWLDPVVGAPVTGYQLYRSTSQFTGYTLLATVPTGGTYTDAPVTNGTKYYYYLVSVDNVGGLCHSASATVFTTAARPPNAPTGLRESDGDNAVTLHWLTNGPLDTVNVNQYVITRNAGPLTAVSSSVTAANVPVTYVDSPAADGSTFVYLVYAVNANSVTSLGPSAPVTGYPFALSPPAVTSASSNTEVTLSWSAPATSSFTVTGYAIYRRNSSGTYNPASPLTVVGSGVSSLIDSTVALGQLYGYEVEALDAVGHEGPPSTEILDGASNPPPAPTGLTPLPGDEQILIDWAPAAPPSGGSLPVSEYQVVISSGGTPTTVLTAQTWWLVPSTNGVSVTFTVTAIDETGQALPGVHESVAVTVTAASSQNNLNPPTNLAAKGTGTNTIQLTWTPANDLGRIVTGYAIYRTNSFGATLTTPVTTLYNTAFAPVTVFNNTGLSVGVTYFYVARAVYSVPVGTSSNSNHAYATTLKPPPTVVTVKSGQMVFDANLVRPLLGQTLGISYEVPSSGSVELNIYNIAGRLIRSLSVPPATAGTAEKTSWDMKDKNGNVVASGIYLIEIKSGLFHQILKVAVVK